MIHGATIRRASTIRTTAETTTTQASQTHGGTERPRAHDRRRLRHATIPDSTAARASAAGVVDADLGGSLGDPPEHRVVDRVAAGRDLERRDVRVGDARQRVLALDVRPRGRAELRAVLGGEPERRLERRAPRTRRPGTLSTTSSGSSANQPTSETTSGLPSDSARITEPEVSPIVG